MIDEWFYYLRMFIYFGSSLSHDTSRIYIRIRNKPIFYSHSDSYMIESYSCKYLLDYRWCFMRESVFVQDKKKIKLKLSFLKKDLVFSISLLLAALSCFKQPPRLEYINFHVLISLFSLMIAIKAFEELNVMDKLAVSMLNKSHNSRAVSTILILLCFFGSMFFTNDVALLTFVPITLLIGKKTNSQMMETVILQTIAANMGSSLTPMGNPQNLFIYSYFGIEPIPFFSTVLLMAVLGIILLLLSISRIQNRELKVDLTPIQIVDRKKATVWGIVLALIIVSIFGLISSKIALFITLLAAFIFDKRILFKIDYLLLLTFVCFFIFVGNVSSSNLIESILKAYLNDSSSVFFSSIAMSQFISNVPAAILLANFTADWKPLLLGVNIGGLGTIIASLASVISYKLFAQAYPREVKKYLIKYSFYNFSFLMFLTVIHYFLL